MNLHYVVCLALLPSLVASVQFRLAISVSTQSPSPFLNSNGIAVRDGLLFWQSKFNQANATGPGGVPLSAIVEWREDYGNASIVSENYSDFISINDSIPTYLLGPMSTGLSLAAKAVTEPANRLLLGTKSGSTSFTSNSRKVFSITTAPRVYATAIYPTLRLNKVHNITIIQEDFSFPRDIAAGFSRFAPDFGIQVLNTYVVASDSLTGYNDEFVSNVTNTLNRLIANQTDAKSGAIVVAAFASTTKVIIQAMKNISYAPNALVSTDLLLDDFTKIDPELTAFVSGCDVIAPDMSYRDDFFGTYADYLRAYTDAMGHDGNVNHAIGSVAGHVIANAVAFASSFSDDDVTNSLARLNIDTFYGPIEFSADHSQLRPVPMLQFAPNFISTELTNNISLVGPDRIRRDEWIYPMPSWSERQYAPTYSIVEQIVFALTAVGMAFSVAIGIAITYLRDRPSIKTASYPFLMYILVGTLIMYPTNFVWTMNMATNVSCALAPVFLSVGNNIILVALFAKTWRITRFFEYIDRLRVELIPDGRLTIMVGAVVAIKAGLAIAIAYMSAAAEIVITDPYRPSLWYAQCTSISPEYEPARFALVITSVCIDGALLVFGSFISFRMKDKVYMKHFNESKVLAYILYMLIVLGILGVAFHLTHVVDREALYIIRSCCILAVNTLVVGILYGTKLSHLDAQPVISSHSSHLSSHRYTNENSSGPSLHRTVSNFTSEMRASSSVQVSEPTIKQLMAKFATFINGMDKQDAIDILNAAMSSPAVFVENDDIWPESAASEETPENPDSTTKS